MEKCRECNKNIAVVFVTNTDNYGNQSTHGLCLRCAKELNVVPVKEILQRMGLTEEEFDKAEAELNATMEGKQNEKRNM